MRNRLECQLQMFRRVLLIDITESFAPRLAQNVRACSELSSFTIVSYVSTTFAAATSRGYVETRHFWPSSHTVVACWGMYSAMKIFHVWSNFPFLGSESKPQISSKSVLTPVMSTMVPGAAIRAAGAGFLIGPYGCKQ